MVSYEETGETNLWSPMKKQRLNTWKSSGKGKQMVELKTRPELNLKKSIGKQEFSVVPRSLFAAGGTSYTIQ